MFIHVFDICPCLLGGPVGGREVSREARLCEFTNGDHSPWKQRPLSEPVILGFWCHRCPGSHPNSSVPGNEE